MTKIRTAEDVLMDCIALASAEGKLRLDDYYKSILFKAMKEYAKQFIDAAADSARTRTNDESTSIIVDKESILKIKERVV